MRHLGIVVGTLGAAAMALTLVQCVGDTPNVDATDVDSGTDSASPTIDGASSLDSGAAPDDSGGGASDGAADSGADVPLAPLAVVPSIGSGFGLVCTNRANGHVYCWGKNDTGQLGNLLTSTTPTYTPTPVALIATAAQVAVGISNACALLTDHTVSCWGNNSAGELGHPIAADSPNTYNATPTKVAGLSDVMEIGAGGSFMCARKADGSVWCWGGNNLNTLGHSNTMDVACVGGTPCSATPTQVPGIVADQLALGFAHACARVGATAYCWGDNEYGQLGHLSGQSGDVGGNNPTPKQALATNVSALFAGGGYLTCMLDPTSTASCWGQGASGQLGDKGALSSSASPVVIAGLPKTVKKVAGAFQNACAAMINGGVYCWGANGEGGDGVPDASGTGLNAAALVTGLSGNIVDIAGGRATDNWCALTVANDVYCWGINPNQELGHDNASDTTCQGQKCSVVATKVQNLP